jgi:hypothetical protein
VRGIIDMPVSRLASQEERRQALRQALFVWPDYPP